MTPILGYITEANHPQLYHPQMVADCLGQPVSAIFAHASCCLGGGQERTTAEDGSACVFSGTLLNLPELLRNTHATTPSAACLELYRILGADFPCGLRGPFTLLIYDGASHCLRVYRDHLGQNPLFYARLSNGTTLFSDNLNCLQRLPGCPTAIDLKALADFLSLGYVPAPETIYHGIRKLDAGSCLALRSNGGLPAIGRYWQPAFAPKKNWTAQQALAETHCVIDDAVKNALAAAPDSCVMLSGGIDSNLIAAFGRQATDRPVKTSITVGFDDQLYDERPLAALSAETLGLTNTQQAVTASDWSMLGRLQQLNGEPFGDSSLIPTAVGMSLAARSSRQVLTGSGGDELFGGYRRYQAMALREALCTVIPGCLSQLLSGLMLRVLPQHRDGRSRLATIRRMASFLKLEPLAGYAAFQEIFSPELKQQLLQDSRIREQPSYLLEFAARLETASARGFAETCNELDALTYLPDDGCVKERLAADAAGIRHLSPLLDPPVVELGLSLPRHLRITLFQRKRMLRMLGQGMLHPQLLTQGKRGFGMPVASWFRTVHAKTAQSLANDLPSWDEQGWFRGDAVARLVNEHLQGKADHGAQLWILLCLKEWLQGRKRQ